LPTNPSACRARKLRRKTTTVLTALYDGHASMTAMHLCAWPRGKGDEA
jgi:hypothetical protein